MVSSKVALRHAGAEVPGPPGVPPQPGSLSAAGPRESRSDTLPGRGEDELSAPSPSTHTFHSRNPPPGNESRLARALDPNPRCPQILARLSVKCLPPAPLWGRQEGPEEHGDPGGQPSPPPPPQEEPARACTLATGLKPKRAAWQASAPLAPSSPAFGGWAIFRRQAGWRKCLIHPGG